VGGVFKTFTLNAKGASPKANDTFKISVKAKSGVVAAQVAKFQAKFNKGNFAAALADEGMRSTTVKATARTVTVRAIFNNRYFQKVQSQLYSSIAGKSGKTTTPK
jgi:hypothetical protein